MSLGKFTNSKVRSDSVKIRGKGNLGISERGNSNSLHIGLKSNTKAASDPTSDSDD